MHKTPITINVFGVDYTVTPMTGSEIKVESSYGTRVYGIYSTQGSHWRNAIQSLMFCMDDFHEDRHRPSPPTPPLTMEQAQL